MRRCVAVEDFWVVESDTSRTGHLGIRQGKPQECIHAKNFPNVFDPKVAFMNSRILFGVCIIELHVGFKDDGSELCIYSIYIHGIYEAHIVSY